MPKSQHEKYAGLIEIAARESVRMVIGRYRHLVDCMRTDAQDEGDAAGNNAYIDTIYKLDRILEVT